MGKRHELQHQQNSRQQDSPHSKQQTTSRGHPVNYACFFPFNLTSLAMMENMRAGFIAEGLYARERAIDAYMEKSVIGNDKGAREILRLMAKIEDTQLKQEDMMQLHAAVDILMNVDPQGDEWLPPNPEECPLGMYTAAVFFLHPAIGVFKPVKARVYAKMAHEQGCWPAQAIRMDLAIRGLLAWGAPFQEPGEGEDEGDPNQEHPNQKPLDQEPPVDFPSYEEIEAELDELLRDPTEETLLIAGRALALVNVFPQDFANRIRERLKVLAKDGHVDALRLLALSHTVELEPEPEVKWARERIFTLANEGQPFARLIKAQHLACLYAFWHPEQAEMGMPGIEAGLWEARTILEDLTKEKYPWAATTLAWLYLDVDEWPDVSREEAIKRALQILEDNVNDEQFPPSAALAGAACFNLLDDVEQAWEPLRWAAESGYSSACEAACGHFLMSMIENACYVESVKAGLEKRPDDFDEETLGDTGQWNLELVEMGELRHFGVSQLYGLRMSLAQGMPFSEDEPDNVTYSLLTSKRYVGPFTVLGHLLNLGHPGETTEVWRERLERCLLQGAVNGEPNCLVGYLFFGKSAKGGRFKNRSIAEIQTTCAHLSQCSPLAHLATCFLNLLTLTAADIYMGAYLDDLPKDHPHKKRGLPPGHAEQSEFTKVRQLELLRIGLDTARKTYDLPALCLLPVLLRMAEASYEPNIVADVTSRLSDALFEKSLDFKGIVRALSKDIQIKGVDARLLWVNLGVLDRDEELDVEESARTGFFEIFKDLYRLKTAYAEARGKGKGAKRKKGSARKTGPKRARRKPKG